jgi:hypothetical protein
VTQEIRTNSIIGFVMKAGKRDGMLEKTDAANELHIPVAIFDKELLSATSFRLQTFELCTVCGARFGIGYHGACAEGERFPDELEDLPKKLTAILAKDHRQERAHKHFIELDI